MDETQEIRQVCINVYKLKEIINHDCICWLLTALLFGCPQCTRQLCSSVHLCTSLSCVVVVFVVDHLFNIDSMLKRLFETQHKQIKSTQKMLSSCIKNCAAFVLPLCGWLQSSVWCHSPTSIAKRVFIDFLLYYDIVKAHNWNLSILIFFVFFFLKFFLDLICKCLSFASKQAANSTPHVLR